MFVIMQCFDNLKPSEKRPGDNAYNIGMTMKHAGVAISVTSITDVVVFGVGASTVRAACSTVYFQQQMGGVVHTCFSTVTC